jgi:hypothetical protein
MYAWSRIWAGGEVDVIETSGGGSRNVVTSRNEAVPGAEVSQSDLGVSDEEWQNLQDIGAVRPYPFPEGTDETTSPQQAFLASISTSEGEIDANLLMEMSLAGAAPVNPPAAEAKEVTKQQPEGA